MDCSGITIMPIQLQGTEYKTYIVVMLWNFETFYMYQPACCIIFIVYILRFAVMNRILKRMLRITRYFYFDTPSCLEIV